MSPQVHDKCHTVMLLMVPPSNPRGASEWYCKTCHFSQRLTDKEVNYWLNVVPPPQSPPQNGQ